MIVLVAALFLDGAVYKGLLTIVIGVVTRIERLPPAALGRILLRRTRSGEK